MKPDKTLCIVRRIWPDAKPLLDQPFVPDFDMMRSSGEVYGSHGCR